MTPFTEDDAQRMFDRLGSGVAEDRPALAELVVAADRLRERQRRTTRWVVAASVAAAVLVVGGTVAGVTARDHSRDVRPAGTIGDVPVVSADQLTGGWHSGSPDLPDTLAFAPAVGPGSDSLVEVVEAGRDVGEIALGGDGSFTVTVGAVLPQVGRLTLTAGGGLRLGYDDGASVEYGRDAVDSGSGIGLTPVTSVNQIVGTWQPERLLGASVAASDERLIITTSWLAVRESCAAYQRDYTVDAGTLALGDAAASRVGCDEPGQLAAAAVGQGTTVGLDHGRLVLLGAGGERLGEFRRADPTPGPSAPQLVGRWVPVGTPGAELDLTLPAGATSGHVSAHSGDCTIDGIWYLTRDGTFVSSAGPTNDSPIGCDEATPDLNAFENISRAELVDGRLRLLSPAGVVLVRYDSER